MNDFYYFGNGAIIDNATINSWLNEIREKLLLDNEDVYSVSSGDSFAQGQYIGEEKNYLFIVATNSGYAELVLTEDNIENYVFNYARPTKQKKFDFV